MSGLELVLAFLAGIVGVDSGTLVVGDPAYLLPRASEARRVSTTRPSSMRPMRRRPPGNTVNAGAGSYLNAVASQLGIT